LNKDRQARTPYGEAGDLSSIATIYLYQSNMPQALNYYQQSAKILKSIPEKDPKNYKDRKRDEAAIYSNIGLVYIETGEYPKAVAHFEKAIASHLKQQNKLGTIPALGNIANVYSREKNYTKAILYADSATKLADALGDKMSYARETGNLSGYYSSIGKYDQALRYGLRAVELNKTLGNTKSVGFNLQNVSSAYAKKGNTGQAKQYGLASLKIGQDLKIPEIQRDASSGLSEIYEALKMPDSALFYYKTAAQLKDSINNSKKRDEIARLSIQYEFDKKENDYKQQQVLSDEQLKRQRLYAVLAVVVLISILLFMYNKYRIRQLRFKSTLQQQLSESELKAIRSQMNPHFIFNVLNSIESYIMDNDKKIASRLIQKFAALSRLILENSTRSLVIAEREWKAMKLYTELEAMRYSNAFSYEFKLDESIELKDLLLPPMLVQPLIENAILHGLIVEPKPEAHLIISLERNQSGICVTVTDNGVGFGNGQTPKSTFQKGVKEKSMGLESIRERIAMINKQSPANKASFSIKPGEQGIGTIAVICLPVNLP
ncbi:MAG TPA: tetratricopeptide repeat protein, partial [Pedobacter sp.]|uniref:tetratricopeptide repeat-containing sensor histidine kinase n=1 Tax=Pedobacter sp. TaxID=1411316 RepID=UPI002BF406A5